MLMACHHRNLLNGRNIEQKRKFTVGFAPYKKRVCDSDYQIKQVFMCKNTSSKEGDLVDILINFMMKSIFVYEA